MTEPQINEDAVINRFYSYIEEGLNIQDAVEKIVEDFRDDEDAVEQTLDVKNILILEIAKLFADKYDSMTNCYDYASDEDNLNSIFQTFVSAEGLTEKFSNLLAATINTAAALDEENDDDIVSDLPYTRRNQKMKMKILTTTKWCSSEMTGKT
jgi:F0F1-type ATP synthase delta subunit